MAKYLFVSPHPDDVEIGCGALVAELVYQGHEVVLAVCAGEGDLRMVHSGKQVTFDQRKQEQRKAAAVLGIDTVEFMGLAPASKFDTVPMSLFVSAFDILFKEDYKAVVVPLPSHNRDHQVVWEASLAAFRQGKLDDVSLYAYEQAANGVGDFASLQFGLYYVGLSEKNLEKQVDAINCHRSQMEGRGVGLCSPRTVYAQASLRGAECGCLLASRLHVIRIRNESLV